MKCTPLIHTETCCATMKLDAQLWNLLCNTGNLLQNMIFRKVVLTQVSLYMTGLRSPYSIYYVCTWCLKEQWFAECLLWNMHPFDEKKMHEQHWTLIDWELHEESMGVICHPWQCPLTYSLLLCYQKAYTKKSGHLVPTTWPLGVAAFGLFVNHQYCVTKSWKEIGWCLQQPGCRPPGVHSFCIKLFCCYCSRSLPVKSFVISKAYSAFCTWSCLSLCS